jgi:S-methylmethionine-dependent homocysteine/selenocysteine methylase
MIIFFSTEEEKAQCYVAASVGPYGAMLSDGSEFNGWYTDSLTIEVFVLFFI